MTMIELLLSEAKNYSLHGWYPIPIGAEKQPPKGCGWTDKRGTSASKEYLEEYFNNRHDVKRLAILLDSSELGLALDIDGPTALDVFRRKVLPKCSHVLQNKIYTTTHTKTPSGYHWLFGILVNEGKVLEKHNNHIDSSINDILNSKLLCSIRVNNAYLSIIAQWELENMKQHYSKSFYPI